MLRRRVQPADVDRHQDQREQDRRDHHRGLAQRLQDRAPRHLAGLREQASRCCGAGLGVLGVELAAGLGQEDVVERRRVQLEVGDREVRGVERAHDRRRAPRRCSSRTAAAPGGAGDDARRTARAPRATRVAVVAVARASPRPSGARSRPSAPPACPRRRSGPRSMIPTRSASTSASSRYCVVRKTVTPSSRASRATSSHRSARLCGIEAGRRLVEEQHARAVHEREREVEPALHAAGVAADLAVGRVGQPDALEQLVAARAALGLRQALQRRLQPHVLAPGEQRVERRLLQRGADRRRAPPGPRARCRGPPRAPCPRSAAAAW